MSSQQNPPANPTGKNLQTEDASSQGGKTKAQIRAENRERQEKQRAAKASAAGKSPGGLSIDAGGNKTGGTTKAKQKKPATPARQDDTQERRPLVLSNDQPQSTVADVENKIRDLRIFSHFGARGHLGQKIKGEIHPSIIRLGLLFAEYKITGANARCIAALTAFKTVTLGTIIKSVSIVFLGTHALHSNGALYSRAGTALVAMMAKQHHVPVLACCETYKFSDSVNLDSFTKNELVSSAELATKAPVVRPAGKTLIEDFNLQLLNPLYDLTPPAYITAVVTEVGLIPVSSVPTVLSRETQAA
ncbi:hypothetical protein FRC06_011793 [Ceratobasidium sp. 370]|nr:hypothetical protein FRC06_011793 [Ceratobasidium sp. 370]